MPRALWLLIFLRFRGGIRRALFSGSARKTVATIVGAMCMFLWLGNFLIRGVTRHPDASPQVTRLVGPVILVILTLVPLAIGGATRMLAFTPVEIDQLFPAPFSRRQLVVYRLVKVSFLSLFTGLFYALVLRNQAGSWIAAFAAACLAWMFISFLNMVFALLEAIAGARIRLLRFVPQALLLATLVIPIWSAVRTSGGTDLKQRFNAIVGTPALQFIAAPFKPFIMLFTAATPRDIVLWLAVSLALTLAAAFAAVRLDAAWLDISVQTTHARAQRFERKTKGHGRATDPLSVRLQRLVPQLNFAGPARAIIRRHLVATPGVFVVPIIVPTLFAGAIYLVAHYAASRQPAETVAILLPLLGAILLLGVPAAARLDFRSDLDHFELLKSLPLGHTAITLAQLAAPTALLALLAWELLLVAFFFLGPRPIIFGAALCTPPAAALLIAVENILFLAAPTRLSTQQVAALQVTGKRAIMFFIKFVVLGACGGLVALLIAAVLAISGSVLLSCAAAAIMLAAEASLACLLVARLFKGFDVAVDMPD